jgi:Cu/Ag efflux protein CusF
MALATALAVMSALAGSNGVMAQGTEATAVAWTAGEIRKIDKDAGKVTIRHEDIKNLNMPAMTMVFTVKNKSLLDGLKVGAKIQFMAVQEQGKLTVTDIRHGPEGDVPSNSSMDKDAPKQGRNMKHHAEMMAKMEIHIEHMREMVQKWDAAPTPEARQALMKQHHDMMHEGMEMSPNKGDHQHH